MDAIGKLDAVTIDCRDPLALARFWAAVFDTDIASADDEGPRYVDLRPTPGVPTLRFQRVPEPKSVKNRLHLDVAVADLEAAEARVAALGGTRISPGVFDEFGYRWIVMADPEGNEFCLVLPPKEARDG
ncbi:MAG: lactoylglutathione lyase [Actinomycetota bacterium]|nr:MAG: lactoylglutathione lyase [Actinomycetota bacterium]